MAVTRMEIGRRSGASDNGTPLDSKSEETDVPWKSLSEKERLAAELWVAGRSNAEIAGELKVNRTTVWRWLNSPAAIAYVRHLSLERARSIVQLTRQASELALKHYAKRIAEGDDAMAKDWVRQVMKSDSMEIMFGG